MSKSIELTQSQIKALQSGATMFLFTIDNENISIDSRNPDVFLSAYKFECIYCKSKYSQCIECYGKGYIWDLDCKSKEEFIAKYSPLQKGDKDIFVQEDFRFNECGDYEYKTGLNTKVTSHLNINQWQPASKMTKEQSRYSFNECIDIKIVRVKEINIKDIPKIQTKMWMFKDWYNQQLKKQNINRTYEDNDYVFLVEFA